MRSHGIWHSGSVPAMSDKPRKTGAARQPKGAAAASTPSTEPRTPRAEAKPGASRARQTPVKATQARRPAQPRQRPTAQTSPPPAAKHAPTAGHTPRTHTFLGPVALCALFLVVAFGMGLVYLIAAKLAIATVHPFLAPVSTKAFITGALCLVVEIPLAGLAVQVIRGFAIPGTLHASTEFGELVDRGFTAVGGTRPAARVAIPSRLCARGCIRRSTASTSGWRHASR
jgi:hypothetical protein